MSTTDTVVTWNRLVAFDPVGQYVESIDKPMTYLRLVQKEQLFDARWLTRGESRLADPAREEEASLLMTGGVVHPALLNPLYRCIRLVFCCIREVRVRACVGVRWRACVRAMGWVMEVDDDSVAGMRLRWTEEVVVRRVATSGRCENCSERASEAHRVRPAGSERDQIDRSHRSGVPAEHRVWTFGSQY